MLMWLLSLFRVPRTDPDALSADLDDDEDEEDEEDEWDY